MARSSFCPEAMMSKESIVVALFALVKLMTAGILAHFLRLECDYFWVSNKAHANQDLLESDLFNGRLQSRS